MSCASQELASVPLKRLSSKFLALAVAASLVLLPSVSGAQVTAGEMPQQDTAMREFIMSCTYGVLAGTLVGAAMLAFTDQPGDNLNKVARGASLGLYAGIALGVYVVYVVPKQLEGEGEDMLGLPPPEDAMHKFQVFPMISEKGIDGVAASWRVGSF